MGLKQLGNCSNFTHTSGFVIVVGRRMKDRPIFSSNGSKRPGRCSMVQTENAVVNPNRSGNIQQVKRIVETFQAEKKKTRVSLALPVGLRPSISRTLPTISV